MEKESFKTIIARRWHKEVNISVEFKSGFEFEL